MLFAENERQARMVGCGVGWWVVVGSRWWWWVAAVFRMNCKHTGGYY